MTLKDPGTLASVVVINFNEIAAKQGASFTATTAGCLKTGDDLVLNCIIHVSDDTQIVQVFTVSEDGQSFMSKNS